MKLWKRLRRKIKPATIYKVAGLFFIKLNVNLIIFAKMIKLKGKKINFSVFILLAHYKKIGYNNCN